MLDFQQIYIFYFHAENRILKENTSNVKPIFLKGHIKHQLKRNTNGSGSFWQIKGKNEEKEQ